MSIEMMDQQTARDFKNSSNQHWRPPIVPDEDLIAEQYSYALNESEDLRELNM